MTRKDLVELHGLPRQITVGRKKGEDNNEIANKQKHVPLARPSKGNRNT